MAGLRRASFHFDLKRTFILTLFLIAVVHFNFISAYTQLDLKDSQDDLIEKVIGDVKSQVIKRSIESIAVWRIEADASHSLDTRALVDMLNIRLMEEGLLPEQMIDLSEVGDKSSLTRIRTVYGISYFLQGTKTAIEGNNIRVHFDMLDINNKSVWQIEILGIGKEIPQRETTKIIGENVQGIFDQAIGKEPIGRASILLRSLILPGWGQYSMGKKTKGGILMWSMVVVSSFSIGTYANYKITLNDYQNATSDFDAKWDKVEKSYYTFNGFMALSAGIYIYNLIDTLIELNKTKSIKE